MKMIFEVGLNLVIYLHNYFLNIAALTVFSTQKFRKFSSCSHFNPPVMYFQVKSTLIGNIDIWYIFMPYKVVEIFKLHFFKFLSLILKLKCKNWGKMY